jgi:pimeloyl-ACP methyl ester carboxylesterase
MPVIVVPGITATHLTDEYPLPPQTVWSVMTRDYERTRLHPDNPRFEATQPARVLPGQVLEIAYRELIDELRHNLAEHADQPVPVFPFAYDWRQPLDQTQAKLADFVDEVIDRTKLLRHYADAGYADDPKVHLVGHSMGGLVIAGYLASRKGTAPVAKVVTLATPFGGSFEAVIKMITGTASIGSHMPSSREREAARVTPALYHLLPTIEDAIDTAADVSGRSLFDESLWQPSVRETIAEYVRLYAVSPGRKSDRIRQADELFRALLESGRSHRRMVDSIRLDRINMTAKQWLVVAGTDVVTRVRMRIEADGKGRPQFDLRSEDRQNRWSSADTHERWLTGDGTVPLRGALPRFLTPANVICVTPKDFGYWELGDRVLNSLTEFHGILPRMNMIHRLIVRFLTNARDPRGNTWGRVAPGVDPKQRDWPLELDVKSE